jgi:hypothetical protein
MRTGGMNMSTPKFEGERWEELRDMCLKGCFGREDNGGAFKIVVDQNLSNKFPELPIGTKVFLIAAGSAYTIILI